MADRCGHEWGPEWLDELKRGPFAGLWLVAGCQRCGDAFLLRSAGGERGDGMDRFVLTRERVWVVTPAPAGEAARSNGDGSHADG
jgi:hypothetical protein